MKTIVLCGVLLLAPGLAHPLVSQVSSPSEIEVNAGMAALHQGNFASAEAHLSRALNADPGLSAVRADLGLAYYADHQYLKAIAEFRRALKEKPSLKTAQTFLPLSLAAVGRCREADTGLHRQFSVTNDPKMRRVLGLSLQRCLREAGNDRGAGRVIQALLQQFPNDPDVLYQAGQFYGKLSSRLYLHLMKGSPHSARAYQVMASVAASDGHWEQAINVYRQALRRDPGLQGVHLQIAILLLMHSPDSNAWTKAVQELHEELRLNPASAEAEYEIGEAYRKHGQPEAAVAPLQRALDLDPSAVPARISLAKALRQLGRRHEAVAALKPAEQTDPKNASIHFLLAQLYREIGEPLQAAREQAAFERLQKNP